MEVIHYYKKNGNEGEIWEAYITNLKANHVRINDFEYEFLWSKNISLGMYTPSVGYKALRENEREEK